MARRFRIWQHADVQHHETVRRFAREDGDTDRLAVLRAHREQRLHFRQGRNFYSQTPFALDQFGRAIALDRILDAVEHAVLAGVEEQQIFERGSVLGTDT